MTISPIIHIQQQLLLFLTLSLIKVQKVQPDLQEEQQEHEDIHQDQVGGLMETGIEYGQSHHLQNEGVPQDHRRDRSQDLIGEDVLARGPETAENVVLVDPVLYKTYSHSEEEDAGDQDERVDHTETHHDQEVVQKDGEFQVVVEPIGVVSQQTFLLSGGREQLELD